MAYYNGKKVLSVVAVEYLNPNGTIKLTENGSYDVRAYKKAVVSVFPSGTIRKIEDEGVAQGAGAFPSTILSKGLMNYVGGMSQKINQLVPNNQQDYTNDITDTKTTYSAYVQGVINGEWATLLYIGEISSPRQVRAIFTASGDITRVRYKHNGSFQNLVSSAFNGNIPSGHKCLVCYDAVSVQPNVVGGLVINNQHLTDLTNIYGAGNEPTSTSDPRIQWLIHYLTENSEYDEGSIVNAKVTNLLSTDGTNESNYPIPAEVQALDGYGLGIDDTTYNYIDFENKKFVKKVAKVDLGTFDWAYDTQNHRFYTNGLTSAKLPNSTNLSANILCQKYATLPYGSVNGSVKDNSIGGVDIGGVKYIDIADESFGGVIEDFVASLSNVYLIYELATPTETDISEYLDRDFPNENLIDLYADGKVYFENENNMGVPYSLTYQERIN